VGSVHAWDRYIYVVFFCFSFYFFNIPVDAKLTEVDLKEDFEDTKWAIRFRISKKNRQHNSQKKKYKRVVQGIRMAQNIEESFDASSAHKTNVLIANYERYVCVHLIMVAFESCYNIDLYRCCRIDVLFAQ
jgi:hypothetical protein